MDQLPLVPVARHTDPATSHAAAASVTGLRKSQLAVLEVVALMGPVSDHGILGEYFAERNRGRWPRQSVSGIRTRRSELVTAELVEDSGQRETLKSGRKAISWRVTDWGLEILDKEVA